MLYYLDTCIVIYAAEGPPPFQLRAQNHLTALSLAGHRFLISDLARTESLIKPLGSGDGPLLLEFLRFFASANLRTISLTTAMHDRAALIRGTYHYGGGGKAYGLPDALHLAAAIESGCDRFLTNDARLAGFPDIPVDILP